MTKQRVFAFTLATLFLAGCSGGSQGGSVVPPPAGGAPAKMGNVTIHLRIPRKRPKERVRVARHGHPEYIGVDTQAMQITFKGRTTYSAFVDFNPKSGTCSIDTSGDRVCSLSVKLAPGPYTASITTYDGTNIATAHVLSTAQDVPFKIVAGTSTPVRITLAGVPATLRLFPPDYPVMSYSEPGVLALFGIGTHTFTVLADDADGEGIIGPGAPALTMTSSSGAFVITEPKAAAPTSLSIFTDVALGSSATLTLKASYAGQTTDGCAQPQAVCSATIAASLIPLIAVSNAGDGSVSLFADDSGGTGITANQTVSTGSGSDPQGVAYDLYGNVYVADSGTGNALVFPFPYSGSPAYADTSGGAPKSVTVDKGGNLYVLDSANHVVDVYAYGVSTPVATLKADSGACAILAVDGGVLVANQFANSVSIFASTGSASAPFAGIVNPLGTLTNGISSPISLAIDSTTVYVGSASNSIKEYTLSSGLTTNPAPVRTITTGISTPISLAVDTQDPLHSGFLYVANLGNNTVTAYKPGSTSVFGTISTGVSAPRAVAFDPTGNLLVANVGANTVTEYQPGASTPNTTFITGSEPVALTVEP